MDDGDFNTAFDAASFFEGAIPVAGDAEPLKFDDPSVLVEGILLNVDETGPEQGFDEPFVFVPGQVVLEDVAV